MLGAGYASVGTINGVDDDDYHYGIAPQALVALRLIFGERASLDLTGRDYFVSKVAAGDAGRHDNIGRADVSVTWRISEPARGRAQVRATRDATRRTPDSATARSRAERSASSTRCWAGTVSARRTGGAEVGEGEDCEAIGVCATVWPHRPRHPLRHSVRVEKSGATA